MTAPMEALARELREWCESTLNVFLAEVDLEASHDVVEQLAQVVEAHAKELALLASSPPSLREALEQIAKGEGAYSTDRLTHAMNCIDNMKAIATAALGSPVPAQEKDQ